MQRRKTKVIKIGNIKIGGNNPVTVQSMTNTQTSDIKSTVSQIEKLERTGCDLIRVAVPDSKSAQAITKIKSQINIPLVADIHFDYRLAITSIENGADKIRINPGNIGHEKNLVEILQAAKKYKVPIRIGVNSGSIEKDILNKFGKPSAEALAKSALEYIKLFEKHDFEDIVVSIKSSDVLETIKANRLFAKQCDYPLHLGITEAGTLKKGSIRSSVAVGILLAEGIGDTIRVSLSADPVEEIKVAREILGTLGLRKSGPQVISCPTCSRTKIDVIDLAESLEKTLENSKHNYKIAVMGCEVNGPGEAKEANLGVVGGIKFGTIYKDGKVLKQVPKKKIIEELEKEIND